VQGRIRLKVWLSTREDRGTSEEENSADVVKLERLHMAFMSHELVTHEPSWTWSGDIPGPALTILHQMAVQADLTDLQCSLAR
jgi:BAI1-associated protein 3